MTFAAALGELADPSFSAHGFGRKATALQYRRNYRSAQQSIKVGIEHGPKDNPDAAAAVYPWLSVQIPQVDALVMQMLGRDKSLVAPNSPTLSEPIEFTAPKGTSARWYIYQADSIPSIVDSFMQYSEKWVLPFLAEYCDAAGVAAMNQNEDERLLRDEAQRLRAIAAMLLCGNSSAAKEMIVSYFGRPAMRRRYSTVFEFVDRYSSRARA